ncbi:MAG: thioredoxin domain-containing protein [Chloroflexi bacterium]|nr:thioredoxin domain-containing protein [Chloroflexota bacterium]
MSKQKRQPKSSRQERLEARRQRESRRKKQRIIALTVVTLGLIGLIAIIYWNSRPEPFVVSGVHTEQPPGADGMSWGGPENAAVVIEEYSDFQCPYCGRHATETIPQLIEKYGNNPNVRYVFHPYPFIGTESVDAAAAGYCASEQNLFWAFHDTVFANQRGENQGQFSKDNLKAIAKAVGLNMSQFNECFDSGRTRVDANRSLQEGRQRGIQSTPMFFVNGKLIKGAQPASVFIEAIDNALTAAGVQ